MNKKVALGFVVPLMAIAAVLALTMPAPAVNKNISNEELLQLQNGGALVVDVRTQSEFASGHIPSAENVPLDQLQATAASWGKDQPVVVYCATGARSANAAAYLVGQGFRKVYNLEKGIAAWNGQVVGGQGTSSVPSGPGAVKTSGKPLFIDFSSST